MQKLALITGMRSVLPENYGGWEGVLPGTEGDRASFKDFCVKLGFEYVEYWQEDATAANILQGITDLATSLRPGDVGLWMHTGHGSQTPDTNGDEPDNLDETIVARDREIVDDEQYMRLSAAPSGSTIIRYGDTCHSGDAARLLSRVEAYSGPIPKVVPLTASMSARVHLPRDIEPAKASDLPATLLNLGACLPRQVAYDGANNGAFTEAFMATWFRKDGMPYAGSYAQMQQSIRRRLRGLQHPLFTVQSGNQSFIHRRAFDFA